MMTERMNRPQILLVNPPVYDFTAYDYWLRPYGMLRAAGLMRHAADLSLFDYLIAEEQDAWGRGRFREEPVSKPPAFRDIPRRFRRFGRRRGEFREFLRGKQFAAALIQTVMTYWYPGVREVIEDLRELQPAARIVLGGVYATISPAHARSLGPDLVVEGRHLEPLWHMLSIVPRASLPFWEPPLRQVGVLKLTEGCPFRCTYCSVPLVAPAFGLRAVDDCFEELRQLVDLGARNVAFYDDALLFRSEELLAPFLERILSAGINISFHTPNALNARFIGPELARLMVRAGFSSFFLGFESDAEVWQKATGGKVCSDEFTAAVRHLRAAGAKYIASYVLIGHPETGSQDLEQSIRFAHESGTRVLLAEFSPIPGTPDGERCRPWVDLAEPLSHNKTAFSIRRLGAEEVNRLKALARDFNSRLQ